MAEVGSDPRDRAVERTVMLTDAVVRVVGDRWAGQAPAPRA
jgi:hypothetical protein